MVEKALEVGEGSCPGGAIAFVFALALGCG